MAVTVGGTSITFNDATVQTTAATAPTTAQVLNATAGASTGAVGTYGLFRRIPPAIANPGDILSGSEISYANGSSSSGQTPAGTWRVMGFLSSLSSGSTTVFLRIA